MPLFEPIKQMLERKRWGRLGPSVPALLQHDLGLQPARSSPRLFITSLPSVSQSYTKRETGDRLSPARFATFSANGPGTCLKRASLFLLPHLAQETSQVLQASNSVRMV